MPKALGHLVIVSRANIDLFDYLAEKFARDDEVRVILDRRQRDAPGDSPIGAMDRRHHAVDQALRTRGLAVILPH